MINTIRNTEQTAQTVSTMYTAVVQFSRYIADDLALISSTFKHIEDKTNRLNTYAKQVGLFIYFIYLFILFILFINFAHTSM